VAEKLADEVLSLPIYPELTSEQIEYTAETILKFYGSD
jgi:dTDP-4-amino-4,6-dideoxygalactose transaminase